MLKRTQASAAPGWQSKGPPPVVGQRPAAPVRRGTLVRVEDFGRNPGHLRMMLYLPASLGPGAPLVVALHGHRQSAATLAADSGWADLAERQGFALLLPEQPAVNNAQRSFHWYRARDTKRDRGEVASIREMIEYVSGVHEIDPGRIVVWGFSSGGAMASALLAAYPEVFAAGVILAGVPFGAAGNAEQASDTCRQPRSRPAREWGYLVRSASTHKGPWPRVSIWHGSADAETSPANSAELIKQWTDLHDLPLYPSEARLSDGHEHRIWREPGGEVLVESHLLVGAGHTVPALAEIAVPSGSPAAPSFRAEDLVSGFCRLGPPAVS